MRVIVLGKRRYRSRQDIASLLALGRDLGHSVELLDRDQFLEARLDDVDVVLAKSHYKDASIKNRLRAVEARVINDIAATDRCVSRTGLAKRLTDWGVRTPNFVCEGDEGFSSVPLPWIAKPDLGGDHELSILNERPATMQLQTTFYQQLLPTTVAMKVYTIGNRHHAVRLTYEAPDKFTNPLRTSAGPVSPILVEAVEQVAAATGLEIFNSDFVFHEGLPWVVDVNPFPGLDSFPHASREVWRLIQRS